MRIPIVRVDADGTIVDGTCEYNEEPGAGNLGDFRDLDGEPLVLPPGSAYQIALSTEVPPELAEAIAEGRAKLDAIFTQSEIMLESGRDWVRRTNDPDSPDWSWKHAPRRERKFHEARSRRILYLYEQGINPDTDLEYQEMEAEFWRKSVRFWIRAQRQSRLMTVLWIAILVFDVAIGSSWWVVGGTAVVFAAMTVWGVQQRKSHRRHEAWARANGAKFEERLEAIKAGRLP